MTQLTIQVSSARALQLIRDLEALELIKIVHGEESPGKKMSELLRNSISEEEAEDLQAQLEKIRKEWERGI